MKKILRFLCIVFVYCNTIAVAQASLGNDKLSNTVVYGNGITEKTDPLLRTETVQYTLKDAFNIHVIYQDNLASIEIIKPFKDTSVSEVAPLIKKFLLPEYLDSKELSQEVTVISTFQLTSLTYTHGIKIIIIQDLATKKVLQLLGVIHNQEALLNSGL